MTITAEQAQALKAGITEGPWRVSLTDETVVVSDDIEVRVDGDYDDFGIAPIMSATATAIAAVPDMLATIMADAEEKARMSERIAELEAALTFYADRGEDGYNVTVTDYGLSTDNGHIIKDGGQIARSALNGETA